MHEGSVDFERRLRKVERVNRLLAAAVVVLAGTLLTGMARAPGSSADILQARRIQVVDGENRVRVDIRHDAEETGLFIMDETGEVRLGAAQFAHGGGGFALHGPEAKGAAVLYLQGEGSLTFYDAGGGIQNRFPGPRR